MALTSTGWEAQALRRHLGYGNIDTGAYPYTADGFLELFNGVVVPNLQTALETTCSSSVAAAGVATVTLASVVGISAYTRLVADVGEDAEVVTVRSVSGSTVTARFAKAHTASYPVAIESGTAILRMLLHSADSTYDAIRSSKILSSAGLASVGRGAVEWFEGGWVLKDTISQYRAVVQQISDLVRVPMREGAGGDDGPARLEAY